LAGEELSVEEGVELFEIRGSGILALMMVADSLRKRNVGDQVTYVINRNINFTNVCIKRCGFCAFSRDHRLEQGYFLPLEEVIRRAKEAWELGAREICVQAGLPPKMDGMLYVELTKALKKELPDMHIHGFSPEEVLYGSIRSGLSIHEYLIALKEAGVGSLPGTSAEILNDSVRNVIANGRITTDQWIEVIKTAHQVGIPTTSTIMYGHIESSLDKSEHIALIRDIQKETRGFTEFVPLSFIFEEAPMHAAQLIPNLRKGATGDEVIKMHAVSRIMLNDHIDNIQVSWVKEGHKLGELCLHAGANDLGGTLINESISTSAGASYGQLTRPKELRDMIRDAGRIPVERDTLYRTIKEYGHKEALSELDSPLDTVSSDIFGSYDQLISSKEFRFRDNSTPSFSIAKKDS
jgi:7,8-didemethyl-8-hydroxy-5-deazariboflavin synthase CofH subunit